MSEQILVALIAAGAAIAGSGIVTLVAQRAFERRIATSRAIGEQFAKERFEAIQRLGSLLLRVEREAKRQRLALFAASTGTTTSGHDVQSRLMDAIENYGAHQASEPVLGQGDSSDALIAYGEGRPPQQDQTPLASLASPVNERARSGLLGRVRSVLSRMKSSGGRAAPPEELTPELLDGLLYKWRPLNEEEAKLEAEAREALDDAYLFISAKDFRRVEALLPRSLRGDTKASVQLRTLLTEAMKSAHRG